MHGETLKFALIVFDHIHIGQTINIKFCRTECNCFCTNL